MRFLLSFCATDGMAIVMDDYIPSRVGDALFYMEAGNAIRPLRAFTVLGVEMNPVEYSRRYIDERDGVTDAVGYTPAIRCSFDRLYDDPVHDRLAACFTSEAVGVDAVCVLYVADISGGTGLYPCRRREFVFIPQSMVLTPGTGLPAYSFTGVFHAHGLPAAGTARLNDGGKTLTFYEV